MQNLSTEQNSSQQKNIDKFAEEHARCILDITQEHDEQLKIYVTKQNAQKDNINENRTNMYNQLKNQNETVLEQYDEINTHYTDICSKLSNLNEEYDKMILVNKKLESSDIKNKQEQSVKKLENNQTT